MINSGTKSATTGSTVETVTTDVKTEYYRVALGVGCRF